MSGFAGIVCTGGTTPDPPLLDAWLPVWRSVTGDATQIWSRAGAGFGFTLLGLGLRPIFEQPCTLDWTRVLLG